MVKLIKISNNSSSVEIGKLELYFSYETVVGFRHPSTGLVVSENVWSRATGKHLNDIDGGRKQCRTPYKEFQEELKELMERLGL